MESKPTSPLNRQAVFSVIFALLTLISFCVGVAPIPLSSLVCYPSAVLLGLASLWMGAAALREVRQTGEHGRGLALAGLWTGGLIILVVLCFSAIMISLFPYGMDFIRQLWHQFQVSYLSIQSASVMLASGSG